MTFLLVAIAFVFPSYSLAGADGPEHTHEPHEPHPPALCSQGAVQSCVAEHSLAATAALAEAMSLAPELAEKSALVSAKAAERDEKQEQVSLMKAEIALLSSEIDFSNAPPPAGAKEIFPGFPSPESFFSRRPLDRLWLGRYAVERVGLLTERLSEAKTKESTLQADLDEINDKFRKLSDQYASRKQDRDNLLAAANQHGTMCRGGCHELLCPPREP